MPLLKIGVSTYNDVKTPVCLIQGNATRDAEDKPVNGVDHAVVGIAASETADGTTVYVNLNGWRQTCAAVRCVRKGDSVLAVGRFKKREYNGKEYYDLDADFVCKSGAGFGASDGIGDLPGFTPAAGGVSVSAEDFNDGFTEIADDGELPF